MNWSWLNWAYTFCLTVGTAYTVLSFFLGHFGGDHGTDHGGADAGGDAPEIGGNAAHVGADHTLHFPLFSPVVIAVFLTAFGAGGMIGQEVLKGQHPAMSLVAAGTSGVVFGLLIGIAMAWIMKKTMSTSQAQESDVIGAEALVIVTIPANGIGKISYEAAGTRFTSPARSASGTEIKQDAKVAILSRDGVVLMVNPSQGQ